MADMFGKEAGLWICQHLLKLQLGIGKEKESGIVLKKSLEKTQKKKEKMIQKREREAKGEREK